MDMGVGEPWRQETTLEVDDLGAGSDVIPYITDGDESAVEDGCGLCEQAARLCREDESVLDNQIRFDHLWIVTRSDLACRAKTAARIAASQLANIPVARLSASDDRAPTPARLPTT